MKLSCNNFICYLKLFLIHLKYVYSTFLVFWCYLTLAITLNLITKKKTLNRYSQNPRVSFKNPENICLLQLETLYIVIIVHKLKFKTIKQENNFG